VIQQRWGTDDIPGRILESEEGKDWHHVALPAIALEGDVLGRKPGESLWPSRWPLVELERQKVAMGSRAFECAWQGNPIPLEGALLKSSWFQTYTTPPAEFQRVVCALDSAAKTGIANDFSAIVTVGFSKGKMYVLDVWRAKVEFADLIRRVQALADEDPKPTTIFVEDTSSGQPLIQVLRLEAHLPIVPVKATASKIARVEAICGTLEAGKVLLPKEAPWLNDFLIEALSFPLGRSDDALDAFTICISELTKRKMPANWFFEFGNPDPRVNRFYFGDDDKSPETHERVSYTGDVGAAIGRLGL
jgi:predicted phage terminase large subunit-like protein